MGSAVLGAAIVDHRRSCVPRTGGPPVDAASASLSAAGRPERRRGPRARSAGVRSFRAGRYTDAIAYFRAAYQLGGPSSELWNIVRCREGMDDAEGAAAAIDEYLALPDVLAQDRADAAREAQALRARPSIAHGHDDAPGRLGDHRRQARPGIDAALDRTCAPARTRSAVQRGGYVPRTQAVEARFGRAVIVTLDLERAAK